MTRIAIGSKLYPSDLNSMNSSEETAFDHDLDTDETTCYKILSKADFQIISTHRLVAEHITTAHNLQCISGHGFCTQNALHYFNDNRDPYLIINGIL
ncbi:MAG: hypothetical protein CL532_04380 [Aestuariivita sp.]|nr:hypothetical protein [Aestuariivita sp.]